VYLGVAFLAVCVALFLTLGAVVIRGLTANMQAATSGDGLKILEVAAKPPSVDLSPLLQITATPFSAAFLAPSPTALPTATPSLAIQPWDGKERFTILLMGIDRRPGEKGTAFRTDTLIVVSIDPATRTVGMLSVPRDLFISIPPGSVVGDYGLQRINAAYVIGETVRPGSGPKLAMQTVQYNLGMRINSYLLVDFQAVIAIVDAVGGVDIDVTSPINDPAYPNMNFGYSPLYIPAGYIHMDGALALKYARTRHGSDDLDRARRQQQVIEAVRNKALQMNNLPLLAAHALELWQSMSDNVRSDLTFDQLVQLGLYLKDIPLSSISHGVLDYKYATPINWQGMSVLVPNRARIGPLLVQVFGPTYAK
jgi:LCP family protein required for cell wall assembly